MAVIGASAYKRADSDTRLAQSAGDLVYSSDLSVSSFNPVPTDDIVTWGSVSGIIYFYQGVRYHVGDAGVVTKDISNDYGFAAGPVYVYADENGVDLYDAVQSKLLVATITYDGTNITDLDEEQTGPLVDRTGQTNHQLLTSLQGGTSGEYYHLTQAEHDTLTNISIQTGSFADYPTGGKTITLVRPTNGTNYSVSFSYVKNNTYTEEYTYHAVVSDKTTTSFKVFLVSEYDNAGVYTKAEFANGTFTTGGTGETTIDSIDYTVIEDNVSGAATVSTRSMSIEMVDIASGAPTSGADANGLSYVALPVGAASGVRFQTPIPQDYILGTDIELYVTFAASAASNQMRILATTQLYSTGTAVLGTATDSVVDTNLIAIGGVANTLEEEVFTLVGTTGLVNVTPVARGDILNVVISRDPAHVDDTNAGDFRIINIELKY